MPSTTRAKPNAKAKPKPKPKAKAKAKAKATSEPAARRKSPPKASPAKKKSRSGGGVKFVETSCTEVAGTDKFTCEGVVGQCTREGGLPSKGTHLRCSGKLVKYNDKEGKWMRADSNAAANVAVASVRRANANNARNSAANAALNNTGCCEYTDDNGKPAIAQCQVLKWGPLPKNLKEVTCPPEFRIRM